MSLLILRQTTAIPMFLAIPIGIVIGFLAALMVIRLHAEYVDEVIDEGDQILVRNRGLEESIDLKDIEEVGSTIMQPAGVWIYLRRDSVFGRSIKFLPKGSLFEFSKIAKSLNIRIQQTEQNAAPDG